MNSLNLYANKMNEIYEKYLKNDDISTRIFKGWKVNNHLKIEALYLNIKESKHKIDIGLKTIEDLYNEYINLFDEEIYLFLGWEKPSNIKSFLEFLEHLFIKETYYLNHVYYVIKEDDIIIGFLYLYNYNLLYKKADLGIGLKNDKRGNGYAYPIIESLIKMYLCKNKKNAILFRLGYEVELTNLKSINLVEHKLTFFKKEGLLRNNYGNGIDCYLYSYVLT